MIDWQDKSWKSQNVQIFGYVYRNANGPNHGPAWKIQSFLLSEICTVILWQDSCVNGNSRKFYQNTVGKRFQIVNVYSLTEKKNYSYLCMWTISNWLERDRTLTQCGKYSWKTLIWENRHHSLTVFIWDALKENVRLARILWTITEVCSNQGFLSGLWKTQRPRGNLMPKRYLHRPMTWKVVQRNAWKDIANWRIKQRSIFLQSRDAMHGWSSI